MKASRCSRPAASAGRSAVLGRAVVLALGAVVFGVFFWLCSRGQRPSLQPADERTHDTLQAQAISHRGTRLAEGELFPQLLERLGVGPPFVDSVVTALDAVGFDFGTMHAGDSVSLESAGSAIVRLTYHLDMANGYSVVLDSGIASAQITSEPVDTIEVAIQATIGPSLWESMTAAGADPQLAAAYCEVLRQQVSFPGDVQRGDTYQLVVERLEVEGAFYRFGDILMARYTGREANGLAFLFRPDSGPAFYCDASGRSLGRLLDFPPVQNARRTSDFGPRMHPYRRRRINHSGMDYAACYGTPVRSVAKGSVSRRGWLGGYGRTVDVQHDGADLSSRYAHLCRYAPGVRVGSRVELGQVVGYVGSTGVSTGFHLDFSVRRAGRPVDPLEALSSGFRQVPANLMPAFRTQQQKLNELLTR